MATKTIGVREDVYERLKARKREDESFTDLMNRLLDETTVEWREGFGTISTRRTDGWARQPLLLSCAGFGVTVARNPRSSREGRDSLADSR